MKTHMQSVDIYCISVVRWVLCALATTGQDELWIMPAGSPRSSSKGEVCTWVSLSPCVFQLSMEGKIWVIERIKAEVYYRFCCEGDF